MATLDEHYLAIQQSIPVVADNPERASAVVAKENSLEPLHRWFKMKEAYSPNLVRAQLDRYFDVTEQIAVLDPFAGSGTTPLSTIEWAIKNERSASAVGIEINPFLATLSTAKLAAACRGADLAAEVRTSVPSVVEWFKAEKETRISNPSTTLASKQYFDEESVQELLAMGRAVRRIQSPEVRAVFQVAVAAAIEPSARLRRDGRALRYVASKVARRPLSIALARIGSMLKDMDGIGDRRNIDISIEAKTIVADAREADSFSDPSVEGVGLVMFSPPYPNNIDYTEVYKLENWVLGGWDTAIEMLTQRRKTLRSHPSADYRRGVDLDEQLESIPDLRSTIAPVLASVPRDRYQRSRKNLVSGYALDMHAVLLNCAASAASDANMTYVVGNSLHGNGDSAFVIAADLIIAAAARAAGWDVNELEIARRLHRRHSTSPYLRESIVHCSVVGNRPNQARP